VKILVLNCGSSSLKFQVVTTDSKLIETDQDQCLVKGAVERIGSQALVAMSFPSSPGTVEVKTSTALRDHSAALDFVMKMILSHKESGVQGVSDIEAVGHRVVHGGEEFQKSALIDTKVLRGIENCIELAPLHNPANLKGIYAAKSYLGESVPQVAVFDTSFHSTMPEISYLYPLPYSLYRRHKVRRYGFHGTSHRFVSYRYRVLEEIERPDVNIISLHLGNGCSAALIQKGESYDTSMGFTPLEGLMMGTRSGDIDASILEFLSHKEGLSLNELDVLLNKQSGLLGVSGITNDMRELLAEEKEHNDRRAKLAVNMFCNRIKKYIGAYLAVSERVDALVFTGGIGENSADIRGRVCSGLEKMGLVLDPHLNVSSSNLRMRERSIHAPESALKIYVIPTNEELLIARDTLRAVKDLPRRW
jgi:acetate kinase